MLFAHLFHFMVKVIVGSSTKLDVLKYHSDVVNLWRKSANLQNTTDFGLVFIWLYFSCGVYIPI